MPAATKINTVYGRRALESMVLKLRNRIVLNATVTTPKTWNPFARDFLFGIIGTIQSPMRFTKFAGFDANGDIFGNNDRVGIEPREIPDENGVSPQQLTHRHIRVGRRERPKRPAGDVDQLVQHEAPVAQEALHVAEQRLAQV